MGKLGPSLFLNFGTGNLNRYFTHGSYRNDAGLRADKVIYTTKGQLENNSFPKGENFFETIRWPS